MTMGWFLRSINLLNVILAAAAVAAALCIVSPHIDRKMNFPPPVVKAAPAPAEGGKQKEKAGSEPAGPPIDFMLIADQNLFHPERKIPVEKPQAPPPLPKPELVLYGTLINGDARLAYVDDIQRPLTTPGRGKRMKILRIGDMVSDFKLTEIHPDLIVLARGSEVMTVELEDPKGKRQTPATAAPEAPAAAPKPGVNPNLPRRPATPIGQRVQPNRTE